MSYRVNRALGFQPWGVTNPWVFANYGQPQRRRGYVSPVVFQTGPPVLMNTHLGDTAEVATAEMELLRRAEEDAARAQRMEWFALAGLLLSLTGTLFTLWQAERNVDRYTGGGSALLSNGRRRQRRNR